MVATTGTVEVKQVTQIKILVAHTPGSLARIAEALQKADINIEGACHTEGFDDTMPFRLIVDKPDAAKKVIESLGDPVTFEQCLSFRVLDDKPGLLARIARALGDAHINIESVYASAARGGSGAIYISVDPANLERAKQVTQSL